VVYIREAHALDSPSPLGGGGMPIVYRGGPGPMGFLPDELEQAIKQELSAH
jgi:hypothetical protein